VSISAIDVDELVSCGIVLVEVDSVEGGAVGTTVDDSIDSAAPSPLDEQAVTGTTRRQSVRVRQRAEENTADLFKDIDQS
jgi:hypothetical protein